MSSLIASILFCLLIAALIGAFIGWLLRSGPFRRLIGERDDFENKYSLTSKERDDLAIETKNLNTRLTDSETKYTGLFKEKEMFFFLVR